MSNTYVYTQTHLAKVQLKLQDQDFILKCSYCAQSPTVPRTLL